MKITVYLTENTKCPFREWIKELDRGTRAIIRTRIDRLYLGNFGDCEHIETDLYELRIHYGAGYRVYFGQKGTVKVILLIGGDKSSQNKDVSKAKKYWAEYKSIQKEEPWQAEKKKKITTKHSYKTYKTQKKQKLT